MARQADEVRKFFAQARKATEESAERVAGRSRKRAATRLQAQGILGSPIQEFSFAEIERATQEALAPRLAALGTREAELLSLAEQEEQDRREREATSRRRSSLGIFQAALQLGGQALPFIVGPAGRGLSAGFQFFQQQREAGKRRRAENIGLLGGPSRLDLPRRGGLEQDFFIPETTGLSRFGGPRRRRSQTSGLTTREFFTPR